MLRCITGLAVVVGSLVLVAHGTSGDEKMPPPDFVGKVTGVKLAGPGVKGLGIITVKKKGDAADVTVKISKKTDIVKFKVAERGMTTTPEKASFNDFMVGGFVAVWVVEGQADVAKRIVLLPAKAD